LTSIKNAVAGLKDARVALSPTEQVEYFDLIDEEVNRLEKLVSHLLNISRLESGTQRLEKGLFYLPELINSTLDRLAQLTPFNQHPFESVFEGEFPLISVDYLQIEQLLTNLVENAARYSPIGRPITVTATQAPHLTLRSEESRLGIRFEVIDQGIGIPADQFEKIFQKFYRFEPEAGGAKGVGLGLAICKGIVEAHGGEIAVRSTPGEGSVFSCWLPL
jgi:two-component system sensor histidine kinase KdpD